ncbi:MAG: DNA repair protein RadA [Alphaproteobacteria bacterium]|nr:DNA repair protein RadA [Alphaproteobacteria bacterium]
MPRSSARYVCQECGSVHPRWAGRCEACGAWNRIVEEAGEAAPAGRGAKAGGGRRIALEGLDGPLPEAPRLASGMAEFDRTCGGGLVPGAALLIGGDPGIGKSTLLLQVLCRLAGSGAQCLYVSGEEAITQIRLRARRLGLAGVPVQLAAATNVQDIIATLEVRPGPDFVVIDSIQTMVLEGLDSAPGTVSQVRAAAGELIRIAKRRGICLMLVGHVTKDGAIAGPRVLEHMVDTVLYFEGERGHQFRIMRVVKNRFGPADEIGVFEMTEQGLVEVANPSALFLADRAGDVSGAVVFAGMEGTRPVLLEIQALVAPSTLGTPRRAVVGWDSARLAMVLAVLDARCGVGTGNNDVYLNVTGGLKIAEPAADLAVAVAILSALSGQAMPADMVVFGEVGLSGEVRPVPHSDHRLRESLKLGFGQALLPRRRTREPAAGTTPVSGAEPGRSDAAARPDLRGGPALRDIAHLEDLLPLFVDLPGAGTASARD